MTKMINNLPFAENIQLHMLLLILSRRVEVCQQLCLVWC